MQAAGGRGPPGHVVVSCRAEGCRSRWYRPRCEAGGLSTPLEHVRHPAGHLGIPAGAGRSGSANLPVCRGRHPHLQQFGRCGRPLRLIVFGASNLWFGVTASAPHLPQGQTIEDAVTAHWDVVGAQPTPDVLQIVIEGMDVLVACAVARSRRYGFRSRSSGLREVPPLREISGTCSTPNGRCFPGRRHSGRTRTSGPCRRRARKGTTGC